MTLCAKGSKEVADFVEPAEMATVHIYTRINSTVSNALIGRASTTGHYLWQWPSSPLHVSTSLSSCASSMIIADLHYTRLWTLSLAAMRTEQSQELGTVTILLQCFSFYEYLPIYVVYQATLDASSYGWSEVLLALFTVVFAIAKPYKSTYGKYNTVSITLLGILVIVVIALMNTTFAFVKVHQACRENFCYGGRYFHCTATFLCHSNGNQA